jgi:hypothetical protein
MPRPRPRPHSAVASKAAEIGRRSISAGPRHQPSSSVRWRSALAALPSRDDHRHHLRNCTNGLACSAVTVACDRYPTSRGESRSGMRRLANTPGRRQSSHAATNTVNMTAASSVMLPASAPSKRESTKAPLLLLASKI